MNEQDLRMECLKLAVRAAPNSVTGYHITLAKEYYRTVTEDETWPSEPWSKVPTIGRDNREPQDTPLP